MLLHYHSIQPNLLRSLFQTTQSGVNSIKVNDVGENKEPLIELGKPENKTRMLYVSLEERRDSLTELLHNNKDFEEATIAVVLGTCKAVKTVDTSNTSVIFQKKIKNRLKVFQEITLSCSPRA
jgi:hypothetical protein